MCVCNLHVCVMHVRFNVCRNRTRNKLSKINSLLEQHKIIIGDHSVLYMCARKQFIAPLECVHVCIFSSISVSISFAHAHSYFAVLNYIFHCVPFTLYTYT